MVNKKTMKHPFLRYIAFTLLLGMYHLPAAAMDPIYTNGTSNVALNGYDTVSYFLESKPLKGLKEYNTVYNGATWHFASKENLHTFILDPERYAPQFGGYCAYAVSRNTTASVKPHIYNIHDGKLYLNYSQGVQKRWLKNLKKGIQKANKNWPKVLDR